MPRRFLGQRRGRGEWPYLGGRPAGRQDEGERVKKRIALGFLKYGLGVGILAVLVWRYWAPPLGQPGLKDLWRKHLIEGQPLHYIPLALAFVICLFSVLTTFVRWYFLVRAQGLPFTLADACRLGLVGYFLSMFLPGSIGGDVVKAAFIAREHRRRAVAISTVIMDRVIGLWGLFWLVAILGSVFWARGELGAGPADPRRSIVATAIGLVIGPLLVWFLIDVLPEWRAQRFAGRLERIPRAGHALAEFWRALRLYRRQVTEVTLAMVLAVVGHVGFVCTFYFCALTIFDPQQVPSLATHFLIIPIGMVAQAVPLTPGGIGVGEAVFDGLYQLVGAKEGYGAWASLVQRPITWILAFAGYLVYLQMKPALTETEAEVETEERDEASAVSGRM